MISVILTIFNKENILQRILKSLFENSSDWVKEFIFILDGCTDNSEKILKDVLQSVNTDKVVKCFYTNNVFEIRANNVGLKNAIQPYACIIQDDMQILEKDWDKRLIQPLMNFKDIFAVTARASHQISVYTGHIQWTYVTEGPVGHNCFNKNNIVSRDIFYVSQTVNRGPLMLDLEKVKILGYLDESLPGIISCDDHDMCLKAFIKHGWRCGSYWIQYLSPLEWGSTRTGPNKNMICVYEDMNMQELYSRYSTFLINWDRNKYYEERYLKDNNPDGYIKN